MSNERFVQWLDRLSPEEYAAADPEELYERYRDEMAESADRLRDEMKYLEEA